ncbi:hypothetical protein K2173_015559 [Erythroxylum novogranatense]|uniref:RING-type domain-containing protein n=1 Tax=Erythroxylum novogranatense TaxID=1862640 RepID=A0AAV8SEQ9_9ROSI|nr:hypothetical protein K2173_015559 [Erythroxylum novogranatense]
MLMEQQQVDRVNTDHIIDIRHGGDASMSSSFETHPSNGLDSSDHDHGHTTAQVDVAQSSTSSSNRSNVDSFSFYMILISVKLAYTMILIISSAIVLVASGHEKPQNPLFVWIVGYTAGCAANLPLIFRHYFLPYPRLCRLVDRFKWILGFFFAFWFIVGNFWVFEEKSSSKSYNLYRFCVVLLVIDYIRYTGPLILHAIVICCCWRRLKKIGGAPLESIDALPTYRFNLQRTRSDCSGATDGNSNEFGFVAVGTDKERALFKDDAICCICLANYDDNDELKELPCSHFFHANCVDTWLKIKAFCPLCKCSVGRHIANLPLETNSGQQLS